EALEDLKNRNMGRLRVLHILEQDAQGIPLFEGRLDEAKCDTIFSSIVDPSQFDLTYICGPAPMREAVTQALERHGMPPKRVRYEVFASAQHGRVVVPPTTKAAATRTLTLALDGTSRTVDVREGETILDAALRHGLDAPYACRAGVCSTCLCRITQGAAEMIQNHALDDYEVERGRVLSCQAIPKAEAISVVYDDH
ncbi:MAG: 2Fe-2S iron-sulfur cluster-binding protein, partial [Shimia sp.]